MIYRIFSFFIFFTFSFVLHSKTISSYDFSIINNKTTITDSLPTYYPMAIEGANWLYKIKDEGAIKYYGWKLQGDTLINETVYKKGFRINVKVIVTPPTQAFEFSINPSSPNFFMRDDTLLNKVYVINNQLGDVYNCDTINDLEELRIFDFDAQIDSSLYCNDGYPIVTDIDTIEYFGYSVPRISLEDRFHYQQIGDPKGLFLGLDMFWAASYSEELIEYCVSDEIGCPHELPLSIEKELNKPNIQYSPNPTSDKILISANDIIESIFIYSLDGQILNSNIGINNEKAHISLSDIPSQVLVAAIKIKNGNTIRKLIIKR